MTDLDFERKVNPWLFDSSGNLTEAAKKQFPDLAAAAAGAQPQGWSPEPVTGAGGGRTVKVSPEALRRAGTNAGTLHTKFDKACGDAWKDIVADTQDMDRSAWKIVQAVWDAFDVWSGQCKTTSGMIAEVAGALSSNAEQYARAEQVNAQNLTKN
ncbi:hypothetical protein [Streptomyces rubellomurinus]|uniref:hypothetical protein n=1 Tax=Streptomyces rubellomurinus (strain ATCC 31215) TaxID=359131 RepID=UPI000A50B07F|nr:hypothetical protein [Streptomyces rubellomurinus]